MSHYSEIPQTPLAKRAFKYEAFVEEAASPSSSSGSSVVEEHRHDTLGEVSLPRSKENGLLFNQEEALAPSSLGLEKDEMKSKHDATSPFLVPIDLRRLSTSPLPNAHAQAPIYLSASGHDPVITKHLRAKMYLFWGTNRSYLLVIISTLFGSAMTLFTKLLESGDDSMHPFQILFIRMAVSFVICAAAVYLKQPSEFPLGPKGIRWLLVLRGISGFFGICGIWTSIRKCL